MAKKKKKPVMPTVPRDHDEASYSEMVPFKSTKINLKKSPILIFALVTALVTPFLFNAMGGILGAQDAQARYGAFMAQNIATVFYLCFIMCMALYAYAKPERPFWQYGLVFFLVAFLTYGPFFPLLVFPFREIIPGITQMGLSQTSVIQAFIGMFFIAGLAEEWLKAIPILICAWLGFSIASGKSKSGSFADRFQLTGPLDGIVMGLFAGAGFILAETAGQYVPDMFANIVKQSGSTELGVAGGLSLLLPRVFGGLVGHMGWSGIVGYGIGLAVIRPSQKWKLILGAWIAASVIHALWNSFGSFYPFLSYIIGIGTGIIVVGALLKARQLEMVASGGSGETQGSIIVERPKPAPRATPPTAPTVAPAEPPPASAQTAKVEGPIALNINGVMIPLRTGESIDLGDEPALVGKGTGIMGAIVPHPTRANVLGLRNTGQVSWTANLRDGSQQMIERDQNIRLAPGVSIDFGNGLIGSVQALG